jgi:hypothetical protein
MAQFDNTIDSMSNLSIETHNLPPAISEYLEGTELSHVKLKPWMEEAIAQGHYTPEQVYIMKAQRQKVLDCIAEAQAADIERVCTEMNPQQPDRQSVPDKSAHNSRAGKPVNLPTMLLPECQYKTCQVRFP